ncbi:MAG TPA: hypothetical protein VGK59_06505 [Ohtaekwangia sp.]
MKTRIALLSLAASLLACGTFAQTIENDDMYFSAKDRAKANALKTSELTASAKPVKKATLKEEGEEETLNPTDSYSARNVNPEFAARSNAETAQSDNEDYFINDYKNSTATDLNNWNNNFNSWYGSSWYTPNYYGSSINSWNSPYYGYNDPYMSPWYNPYWNNTGWSTSFSYYWGNSWNYGWGGNYNYWNQPYCGGSSWGPSWGVSMGWASGGWYRPTTVIVVNNGGGEGRNVSYGHRGTRSTTMVSNNGRTEGTRGRTTNQTYTNTQQPVDNGNNGRVASTNRSRQEYYNRSWRNTSSSGSTQSTSSQSNNSNWSWDNVNQRTNNSSGSSYGNDRSYSPSRSSSSSSSGGSRSSGGSSSSGSSSSGGRGRTRN